MMDPLSPASNVAWWVWALAGAASILFGLAALFWPGLTLFVFIALFGIYAIVAGAGQLAAAYQAASGRQTWWHHLVLGLLYVLAGLYVFAAPGVTALVVVFVIAFWAVAVGVVEIIGALFTGRFLVLVAGVVSVLFGMILLANPVAGVLAYLTVIGVFAIVRGILLLVAAVRAPAAGRAA